MRSVTAENSRASYIVWASAMAKSEGKRTVVMGGKRYPYSPAVTDRKENGTLSVTKAASGKVRLTRVYHYNGVLFVIDETVKPGDPVFLEACDAK